MIISDLISKLSCHRTGEVVYEAKDEGQKDKAKAQKGRVKTYSTIRDALSAGRVGEIFSTKAAARTYVISKGKWGKEKRKR